MIKWEHDVWAGDRANDGELADGVTVAPSDEDQRPVGQGTTCASPA
jgi:hypothetical protein